MGTKYLPLPLAFYLCLSPVAGICAAQSRGTLPVVSISSPPQYRIIGGSVTILATVSAGVVGVQFKLDGQNLGAEISKPPFSMIWDTTSAPDGPHTLTALARDAEANQATATVTITVNNTLKIPPP